MYFILMKSLRPQRSTAACYIRSDMVGILTDIAIHNPQTFPVYASILSRMFTWVEEAEREGLLKKIRAKFEVVPHAGQLELWLQRFTGRIDLGAVHSEPLCRSVTDPDHQLWNSDWLPPPLQELVKASEYFEQATFDDLDPVVQSDEVQLFHYGGYMILTLGGFGCWGFVLPQLSFC